ncbi:gamma-glutamylcyclotransferase [Polymorphum gilvum]|uniref:glutathione-specific gamma-glutamylcyclotransferase n=1 Tax=Polymorphum gilvum (strain LMG 25793 / CGMCC 1.9160 / SL003B-26A1) TaxID=991905 RepID=F2IZF0_POLGS|nr:gamma-glutamylcyclotransferase [Polymorphum gilvum]ADZ68573.1 Cation transport regulator-like protein 1 [Polymorphum gilvum SL003B-26A1]
MRDFWVFGYGSLMWKPGFEFEERRPALLRGAHRSLCVYSWVHRGTQERPGLVFGLDRGGACRGMAFRVRADRREDTIAYLREREQATMVYVEHWRPVMLSADTSVEALTYVVDRRHPQYAGPLPLERQLEIVAGAVGRSGANPEYVVNTATHLQDLGIRDHRIAWLAQRLAG